MAGAAAPFPVLVAGVRSLGRGVAYDLAAGREFAVATDPGSQTQPAIWGNVVVWTDWRNGPGGERGTDSDIYAYDLTTRREFPVFVGPGLQMAPSAASDIVAWEDYSRGNSDPDIMGATLSGVAFNPPPGPPPLLPGTGSRLFPETGETVTGVFLDHWTRNGGLAQQGYPISSVMTETSALDGRTYVVQYFERAVLMWDNEAISTFNLGRGYVTTPSMGTERFAARYSAQATALPTVAPTSTPNQRDACEPTRHGPSISDQYPDPPERASVGTGLVVTGTIRSSEGCRPISRARVVYWLAGPDGEYDAEHEGKVFTRPDGTYRIETNFPGFYGAGGPPPAASTPRSGHATTHAPSERPDRLACLR